MFRLYLSARKANVASQTARARAARTIIQRRISVPAPYAAANATPTKPMASSENSAPNARRWLKEWKTSREAAGAEGLEPPTYGFGDRRSTN